MRNSKSRPSVFVTGICIGCMLPFLAYADIEGLPFPLRTGPLPTPTTGGVETDQINMIAIQAGSTDCSVLENLSEQQKKTVLLAAAMLHTEGVLPKIIGPDCHFAGDTDALAIINDPLLTIDGEDEILYHNAKTQTLFVSYSARQTIAYSLQFDGQGDAIEYFLKNRTYVENLAANARAFDQHQSARSSTSALSEKSMAQKSAKQSSEQRPRIPVEERQREALRSSAAPVVTAGNVNSVPTYISSQQPPSRQGEVAAEDAQTVTNVDAERTADENVRQQEVQEDIKPIPVISQKTDTRTVDAKGERRSLWPWIAITVFVILVIAGIVYYRSKTQEEEPSL